MKDIKFGAFVITYQRPELLRKTVQKLFNQSLPPDYILIVDNSTSDETAAEIDKFKSENIGYHKVGYNSGPAGAAMVGLQTLFARGYEWIYWGDDDDPPAHDRVFENLFKKLPVLEKEKINVGILGGKGGMLDTTTGRVRSLSNRELSKADVVEVDSVPGGHTLLVNSKVVAAGILPSPKLFFGFEELDFCVKVKNNGYGIFVDAEDWLKTRHEAGKTDENYQWKAPGFVNAENLWRDYYSSRNLLYIFYIYNYYSAFLFTLVKLVVKLVVGFGYGPEYGRKNFTVQWKACCDFFLGRFGKRL